MLFVGYFMANSIKYTINVQQDSHTRGEASVASLYSETWFRRVIASLLTTFHKNRLE